MPSDQDKAVFKLHSTQPGHGPKEVTLLLSLRGYPGVLLVKMKTGGEFQTEKGYSWRHGMVNILLIFTLVFNHPGSIT